MAESGFVVGGTLVVCEYGNEPHIYRNACVKPVKVNEEENEVKRPVVGDVVYFTGDPDQEKLTVICVNEEGSDRESYELESEKDDGIYLDYVPGRLLTIVPKPYTAVPGDVFRDRDGDYWVMMKDGNVLFMDGVKRYDVENPTTLADATGVHKLVAVDPKTGLNL